MSILSEQYREMAKRARTEADLAQLSNVRQAHLRSAERLVQMAKDIENVARAKARNAAAKEAEAVGRIALDNSVNTEAVSLNER